MEAANRPSTSLLLPQTPSISSWAIPFEATYGNQLATGFCYVLQSRPVPRSLLSTLNHHLMADAGSDWADRPGSDLGLSSDEEDFVSSHSTTSLVPDPLERHHLSTALSNIHLDQAASNHSSEESATTRTSTPFTAMSIPASTAPKPRTKPMQLLDLPLDILKEIVKEVSGR